MPGLSRDNQHELSAPSAGNVASHSRVSDVCRERQMPSRVIGSVVVVKVLQIYDGIG